MGHAGRGLVPEVSRLLERLNARGLLHGRAPGNRRVGEVGLTEKGLGLLAGLDDKILASTATCSAT